MVDIVLRATNLVKIYGRRARHPVHALNDDILGSQALYSSRGDRTTTNQNDSVVSAAAVSSYLFETQKMTDGALLASKTLVLRGATTEALCAIPG